LEHLAHNHPVAICRGGGWNSTRDAGFRSMGLLIALRGAKWLSSTGGVSMTPASSGRALPVVAIHERLLPEII
jgi:hypothetical protein